MFIYIFVFYMLFLGFLMYVLFMFFYFQMFNIYYEFQLMMIESVSVNILILFDWISLLFMSVVLIISSMVMIYSIEYMYLDKNKYQFFILVMLFVMSMLFMILSPNVISILMGWDGLGLVSYCLVIYYQSKNSFNSGMVTVLINRVGDVMILISIGLFIYMGSWNLMFLNNLDNLILFLLVVASMTKSAQLPFSSWLPMAMAAPTPVSSLVHSSTLVTAGVYLMIRMNYLMSVELLNFMMLISIMTMFLSGLGANMEYDLKKIIAFSTLSQLGVMFFSLSLCLLEISLFHLLIHAMFKSMLFMCAGVIIHNMLNFQDIRFISMISYNLPFISILFNCSSLSLCGVPFMSGFYSKDLILDMYLMGGINQFLMILLFMSMGFTLMYSIRLFMHSFIKMPKLVIYCNYLSFSSMMGVSMYLLFFFSIIMGSVMSWILMFDMSIIYMPMKFKLMIYLYLSLSFLLIIMIMNFNLKKNKLFKLNYFLKFLKFLWFMPMLYNSLMKNLFMISNKFFYSIDLGWIEYIMGFSMFELMLMVFKMDYINKNYLYMVMFFMIILIVMIF